MTSLSVFSFYKGYILNQLNINRLYGIGADRFVILISAKIWALCYMSKAIAPGCVVGAAGMVCGSVISGTELSYTAGLTLPEYKVSMKFT